MKKQVAASFIIRAVVILIVLAIGVMIFLSLFASILLSGSRTKQFIRGTIQGIYWQISGAPEQPVLKIEAIKPSKDSSKPL